MCRSNAALQVKLCGFKDQKSIKEALTNGADFIGFIFYDKSPRFIDPKQAGVIASIIPDHVGKVAVVVDASLDLLAQIMQYLQPQYLQLHGAESPDDIKKIRAIYPHLKLIKAIPIRQKSDLAQIALFADSVDYFLFDSKDDQQKGGTGQSFDWNILSNLDTDKAWFLSGGINADNVQEAIKKTNAKMIDVSSAIEERKGEKSAKLIKKFMSCL